MCKDAWHKGKSAYNNEWIVWNIHSYQQQDTEMDDKKERLTSAAHSLFLKNGYKNTNIAQIAKKAGVAVGSFYNYYASKEDIFFFI